jgi:molybdate transport system substrate-binding protein
MRLRLIITMIAGVLVPCVADAAEIKLLGSAAVKYAYLELLQQFEKETGHKVTAAWSSSPDIQKRVAAGEAVDVVILSSTGTEELVKQGKIIANSRTNFATSGIGVVVRGGAPKTDISSAEALKAAVLAAKSVVYSSGASGLYIVTMFEKLGIAEQVKPKVVSVKTAEPVGEVVARGDAEIGFHQVSELVHVKGIQIVGPLPAGLQHITVFSGGAHAEAKESDAARALIKFLTAPAAAEVLKKHGLEPG